MKIFLLSPDKQGRIDGTCMHKLYQHLPNQVTSIAEADVVVVPISFYSDFECDLQALSQIAKKPWVLMDFMEYGMAWHYQPSHLFGVNTELFENLNAQAWHTFSDFVTGHPPAMYFKRELLLRDVSSRVQPLEFPCTLDGWEIEPKANFDARPLEVLFNWGLSHRSRPMLHGEIFSRSFDNGIGIVSDWNQFEGYFSTPRGRTWAAIHTPHYVRQPLTEILRWQSQAKITVSLPGAGRKCFRHGEAPVNSIMYIHEDEMAWSFPWVHGHNCITGVSGNDFDAIMIGLQMHDLHGVYLASQENIDRYRSLRYVNEYIIPKIKEAI